MSSSKTNTIGLRDQTSLTWKERYLEAFVVYFLLGPVMVVAWISTWILLSTKVVYPENQEISIWISAAIGFAGSILAGYFQGEIHDFAVGHGRVFFAIFSRLYSYIFFLISANLWRSIWEGLDWYTGINEPNALVSGLISLFGLIVVRSTRQIVFAPCVLSLDFPASSHFRVESYFGTERSDGWRHIGDIFFSVFIVGFLGFTTWRGWWQFLDFILFPNDAKISGFASLAISCGILILLTILQPLSLWLCAECCRLHWVLGLAVEDVITLLMSAASINYWRGAWILFDIYIPNPDLRLWLGHCVCCFILSFSMAFNSIIARGIALDGQTTDGRGVIHDITYVSNLLLLVKSKSSKDEKDEKHSDVQHEKYIKVTSHISQEQTSYLSIPKKDSKY